MPPSQAAHLLQRANAAHAQGRLGETRLVLSEILGQEPDNVQANLLLAVIDGKEGRSREAKERFAKVLILDIKSFEANFWLSILARREGDLADATGYAERALELRTGDPHALNNLGLCLLVQNDLEGAVSRFAAASTARPDLSQVHHNLGTALLLLGRDGEAISAFEAALRLSPRSVETLLSLGQASLGLNLPEKTADYARRALALAPSSAAAHLLLSSAYAEQGLSASSEHHLLQALELDPADAKAKALMGLRLQSQGEFAEANQQLRQSIQMQPKQGFAYFSLIFNNRTTEEDLPMLETMERLLRSGGLPPREANFLAYGLGRGYEQLGQFERAWRHYEEANRLARARKFGDAPFDPRPLKEQTDLLIRRFTREVVENRKSSNPSDVPVLIVGMMRSGTTLAEQILSAHPDIGAAGEQWFWPSVSDEAVAGDGAMLAKLGREYVSVLRKVHPDTARVTDKMPVNFEILGPIHVAVPNARFIHMRRAPLDTCVSIYATPNRVPISYAHNKAAIVFAYREYDRLMDHWRKVVPEDRLLEVDYENLVADREKEGRRMCEFLGLEWDEALLQHERSRTNVTTPSAWQVRQSIYSTSVGRWRNFEPWLGEFRQVLDRA